MSRLFPNRYDFDQSFNNDGYGYAIAIKTDNDVCDTQIWSKIAPNEKEAIERFRADTEGLGHKCWPDEAIMVKVKMIEVKEMDKSK